MIGGFRSVFSSVRFCVSRFVACDRPVSGNNRLVCFEDFPDLSYSCHLQE